MTVLKALPLISQDLIKVLERRKKGKYRSEKNRKAVAIADMKDIIRYYENEMDTEVEKAMLYGVNLSIYNRLTELSYEDFEIYITTLCALLQGYRTAEFDNKRVITKDDYQDKSKENNTAAREVKTEIIREADKITTKQTKGARKISSGMIPYRG